MYHDSIQINLTGSTSGVNFEYTFVMSKRNWTLPESEAKPVLIKYGELLSRFEILGINTHYVTFPDIKDDQTLIHCVYNWVSADIFFSNFPRLKENIDHITFRYGTIVNGIFYLNNMNFYAMIHFVRPGANCSPFKNINIKNPFDYIYDDVITGKLLRKIEETYHIIDKDGKTVAHEETDINMGFEQHFFEKTEVRLYQRKYKLAKLNEL